MSHSKKNTSRREFIASTSTLIIGAALMPQGIAEIPGIRKEPIIDIHQHIHYHERTDEQMLAHQKAMGITTKDRDSF